MAKKVLVAMSGGVDSSVAAVLLKKAGYQVVGATMKLWFPEGDSGKSRSMSAADDAGMVAAHLGIDHIILDFSQQFKKQVMDYFSREYIKGKTPNPCIVCNRTMKFDLLMSEAVSMGFDYIATGHYARIDRQNGLFKLLRGKELLKDQSYVLYNLTQAQLARVLLPLGELAKEKVRSIARDNGLPVAEKAESQEICFIPDNNYHKYLQQVIGEIKPGNIYDMRGNFLGKHRGYPLYTVGQRRGLGISADEPLYVLKIKPEENAVIAGTSKELEAGGLIAEECNYIAGVPPEKGEEAKTQIRYNAPAVKSTLWPQKDRQIVINFHCTQRAVAPGQSAVFYRGEEVLGGGIIVGRLDEASVYGER